VIVAATRSAVTCTDSPFCHLVSAVHVLHLDSATCHGLLRFLPATATVFWLRCCRSFVRYVSAVLFCTCVLPRSFTFYVSPPTVHLPATRSQIYNLPYYRLISFTPFLLPFVVTLRSLLPHQVYCHLPFSCVPATCRWSTCVLVPPLFVLPPMEFPPFWVCCLLPFLVYLCLLGLGLPAVLLPACLPAFVHSCYHRSCSAAMLPPIPLR